MKSLFGTPSKLVSSTLALALLLTPMAPIPEAAADTLPPLPDQSVYQKQSLLGTLASVVNTMSPLISGLKTQVPQYQAMGQSLTSKVSTQLMSLQGQAQTCALSSSLQQQQNLEEIDNLDKKMNGTTAASGLNVQAESATANALLSSPPDCMNADSIVAAIKSTMNGIQAVNGKIACLMNYQTQLTNALNSTKADFTNFANAAKDIVQKRNDLASKYDELAKTTNDKLMGPDGKGGGLVDQLNNLQSLRAGVREALNRTAKSTVNLGGDKDGKGGVQLTVGLAKELERIQKSKGGVGQKWMNAFTGNVWQCMNTTNMECLDSGQQLSPMECMRRFVQQTSAGHSGERNSQQFLTLWNRMNTRIQGQTLNNRADTKDPVAFLQNADNMLMTLGDSLSQNFDQVSWYGGKINTETLRSFFQQKLNLCRQQADNVFKQDIDTGGQVYTPIKDDAFNNEKEVYNEAMKWVDTATGAMNQFKTGFYGYYDNNIEQWADNCRKSNDATKAVGCLTSLERMLQDGIDGTNGETYQNLPLPIVSVDASGNITSTTQNYKCRGYKMCVDVMQQMATQNTNNAKTQRDQNKAFIQQHNKSFEASLNTIGTLAQQSTALMQNTLTALNQQLQKLGIVGTLAMKASEGTPLEQDDNGMDKAPSSMKAALASMAGLQELDSPEKIQDAIKTRMDDLSKKMSDAADMMHKCDVQPGDYGAIKQLLGTCKTQTSVCGPGRLKNLVSSIESVYQRSQRVITDSNGRDNSIASQIDSCVSTATSDADVDYSCSGLTEKALTECQDRNHTKKRKDKQDYLSDCVQSSEAQLSTLANSSRQGDKSRDKLRSFNTNISRDLGNLINACTDGSDWKAACETLKSDADLAAKARMVNSSGHSSSDGEGGTSFQVHGAEGGE